MKPGRQVKGMAFFIEKWTRQSLRRLARAAFAASYLVGVLVGIWGAFPVVVMAQEKTQGKGAAGVYKWSGQGLRLEISPLSSDAVRAFFLGRGFSAKEAAFIAKTGCLFRSNIGNASLSPADSPVTIDLGAWRIYTQKGRQRMQKKLWLREDWERLWKERGSAEAPRVAFQWALYPSKQDYNPSDYNWGFLTFALPPGTRFDLEVVWKRAGKRHIYMIRDLECSQ